MSEDKVVNFPKTASQLQNPFRNDSPEGASTDIQAPSAAAEADIDISKMRKKSKRKWIVLGGTCVLALFLVVDQGLSKSEAEYEITYPEGQEHLLEEGKQIYGLDNSGGEYVHVKHPNPKLSFFEKHFCRGYKVSFFCDKTAKHPKFELMKLQGKAVPTFEAKPAYKTVRKLR